MRGLQAEIELLTGGTVEISETGGVIHSNVPSGELPGEDYPRCSVRVTLPPGSKVTDRSVALVIEAAKPAHVVYSGRDPAQVIDPGPRGSRE